MTQSRRMSLIETLCSVAIGYVFAVSSQVIIFPHFDIHIPLSDNMLIGVWFTVISVARGYIVRRIFNRIKTK